MHRRGHLSGRKPYPLQSLRRRIQNLQSIPGRWLPPVSPVDSSRGLASALDSAATSARPPPRARRAPCHHERLDDLDHVCRGQRGLLRRPGAAQQAGLLRRVRLSHDAQLLPLRLHDRLLPAARRLQRLLQARHRHAAEGEVQGRGRRLRLDRFHEPVALDQLRRLLPDHEARHHPGDARDQLLLLQRIHHAQGEDLTAHPPRRRRRRHRHRRTTQAARAGFRRRRRHHDGHVPDLARDQAEGLRPLWHAAAEQHRPVAGHAGHGRRRLHRDGLLERPALRDGAATAP
eukprot:scaffold76269_cov60-Phaeocystis_antarctica.AAC.1